MSAVLEVIDLSKAFDGVQAVRNVSFSVPAGELIALIGPNGAGKTTCFNLINGQLVPDAGVVRLDGKRIDGLPPRQIAHKGVSRTFQVAATFASMTVRENVELALALANEPALLLMDEPTAGMAHSMRSELMRLAVDLARGDRLAVLFTEHDMDVVFGFADRVIVLDRGSIIAEGTPDAVRANAQVQAVYLGPDEGA